MRPSFPGCVNHALPPKSMYQEARREADVYKWIESEKCGHDLGPQAIEEWYRRFWSRYCRARRLEHLSGKQQWVEFAEYEFGRMFQLLVSGNVLLQDLIVLFAEGWENLDFMLWVQDTGKPREEIEQIISLLEMININITRLDPRQPKHG